MRLLFVCTGNVCRSPLAAGLAEAWVATLPRLERLQVEVLSAGTHAPVAEPMHPHSAAALSRLGGDPAGRRARQLTADLATGADLVLTLSRRQRRDVLGLSPRGLRRTFTLREAAALLATVDVRDLAFLPPEQRVREVALRLDAARAHRGSSDADDIEDPIGRSRSVHDRVADEIADALWPVLAAVLPASAPRPGSGLGADGLCRSA